jgi:hypothetical protein
MFPRPSAFRPAVLLTLVLAAGHSFDEMGKSPKTTRVLFKESHECVTGGQRTKDNGIWKRLGNCSPLLGRPHSQFYIKFGYTTAVVSWLQIQRSGLDFRRWVCNGVHSGPLRGQLYCTPRRSTEDKRLLARSSTIRGVRSWQAG